MVQVDFIVDCASPNAYLVHKVIPGIEERTGVKVNYVPALLGGIFKATGNQAPMIAFGNIKNKLDYDMLETRRFVEKHGLSKFTMNPHFPVITLLSMRGAMVAEREGRLMEYLDQMLFHMWEEPKKMDDPEVFVEALNSSGFDGASIAEQTQDPEIKAALMSNTEQAVERGAFGIPTIYVGDEMFFGKERLGQVEDEIMKAKG